MLLAVYVYKKSKMTRLKPPLQTYWDLFQDFDYLLNSPYWKQKCDLTAPIVHQKEKNCCPVCSHSIGDTVTVDEPVYLGYCGKCTAVGRLIDWDNAESTIPKIVVAHVAGRPVVFYYLTTEGVDGLVGKAKQSVSEIKDYWGIDG